MRKNKHSGNFDSSSRPQQEFNFNAASPRELLGSIPGLMLSDPTPLRKEWLKKYHEIESKLGKLKSDWRRYEDEAHGGFQKWYHQVFGEELSLLSELGERIREKQTFFTALEVNKRVYQLTDKQAYRKVMAAIGESRDPFPEPEDLERCRQQEAEERELLLKARRQAEADFRAQFANEDYFGEDDEDGEGETGDASQDQHGADKNKKGNANDEGAAERGDKGIGNTASAGLSLLKSLYRKIVRTLHPDLGHQMSPAEKIFWQQTQTAYKSRDLETLKMIALKIEGKGNIVVSKVEQIGELMSLCKTLEQELTSLQKLKEQSKRDPLYQFWISEKQPKVRSQLKTEISGDLGRQVYRLKTFLREANQELEFLAKKYR